ncbi:restriction endonuclease subunit S [Glaesserella parasuis]|nr:restriction endonuclease subunit S [Glaesserella parasuis]
MSSLSNLTIHSIGGGWGKDVEDEGLELVAVIRGTDIPNLEINNIQGVPFRYETQKKIQSRLLQIGDLVIEISGGSASSKQRTGRCLYITDELLKNLGGKVIPASFCKLLRLDRKKVNSKYVYYQIKAMHLSDEIASFENQSTGISNFQFNRFIDEIRPSILDIEVQNKIVNFLEKIDLKIINNININQTLEQIAQTIFKSWFIDFDPVHAKANALASGQAAEQATQAAMAVISGKNTQELHRLQTANPEQYQQLWEIADAFPSGVDEEGVPWGWEMTVVKSVCEKIQNGGTPKRSNKEYWNNGNIPWLSSGEVCNNNILISSKEFITQFGLENSSTKLIEANSTLVALYASPTAGKCSFCAFKATTNQAVCALVPKEIYKYFNFYYLQTKEEYYSNQAVGSAQQNISKGIVEDTPILKPDSTILGYFNLIVGELMNKQISNLKESDYLKNIRDVLLPKLLSGEV